MKSASDTWFDEAYYQRYYFDPKTSVVETHVSRLRGKIDKGFTRELLHTVRGAGYVIRADD